MSPIKEATKKWLHIPSHPRTRHHHPEHVPEHEMTACNLIVDGDVVEHPATYEVDGRRYVFAAWWHEGPILLLRHGQWVPSGTLHVTSIGYTHTPELGLTWGSFTIRGGDFGDVDGTWAWDYGHGRDGFGAGTGADGLHVTITFLLNEPDHLPTVPLPTPDTDVVHLRLTR